MCIRDRLKGFVGASTQAYFRSLEEAKGRIQIDGLLCREIGRGFDGEGIAALVRVIFAGYYFELVMIVMYPLFAQEHLCIFADGHTIYHRYRLHADKGPEFR